MNGTRLIACGVTLFLFCMSCVETRTDSSLLDRAERMVKNKEYEDAKATASQYLAENPHSTRALRLRADCYDELEQYDSMLLDLKALLRSDEGTCTEKEMASNDIANRYDFLLLNDSALKYQLFCLDLQKKCGLKGIASRFATIANLLNRKGAYREAFIALDSAERRSYDSYNLASARGWFYFKMGELDSAILWQTRAIQLAPASSAHIVNDGWDYHYRGDMYQMKGDNASACRDWRKAVELGLEESQVKLDSFCVGPDPRH